MSDEQKQPCACEPDHRHGAGVQCFCCDLNAIDGRGGPHPERLRLSRRKGFNLQALSLEVNGLPAVKVDRTTQWGNPFVPGKSGGMWTGRRVVEDKRHAFTLFRSVAPLNEELVARARAELRGKNLACWCAQEDPCEDACHAAVLLLIANSDGDASEAVLPSLVRRNKEGMVISVRGRA